MISEISYYNTTRTTIHKHLHGEKRKYCSFIKKVVVQINGQFLTDVVYDERTIFTVKKGKTGKN